MKLSVFLLERANYRVLVAVDAEAGISLARLHHPDLILMDIQLPGMDGLTAIAVLKQDPRTQDIPIVALTALVMNGDEQRIRDAGCVGYIAKPMHYRDLLSTVAAELGQS